MKYRILAVLLFFSAFGWAQKIDNVYFRVDGKQVVVNYDLSGCESADVALYLSTNGGKTFSSLPLEAVKGDVGKGVLAGRKEIVWNPFGDYPRGFTGDVAFKVKVLHAAAMQPRSNGFSADVEKITVNGVTFDMIRVDGGTFKMGSKSRKAFAHEKPVHKVTLTGYYIGKYEVTQELWKAVMGNNPSKFVGKNYKRCPVEQVSWQDVQDFIAKLNQLTGKHFALPTEAQWEFAARGGIYSKGYEYSGSDNKSDVSWPFASETHEVGGKSPNELGVYDMTGNVDEMCQDKFGVYTSEDQVNPTGEKLAPVGGSSSYVVRGGDFHMNEAMSKVYSRFFLEVGSKRETTGFRLAAPF